MLESYLRVQAGIQPTTDSYVPKIDPALMCWMHLKELELCGCDYE